MDSRARNPEFKSQRHLSCWETLGQSLNFLGPQFFPSAKWVVANRAVERTEGVNSCKVLKIVLGMW